MSGDRHVGAAVLAILLGAGGVLATDTPEEPPVAGVDAALYSGLRSTTA